MGVGRSIIRVMGSRRFRGVVLGRKVDVRIGIWGEQTVIVDGAPVSRKPWAGFTGTISHFFKLTDDRNTEHNVELRILDRTAGFMFLLHVEVALDGQDPVRLEEFDTAHQASRCPHCGYSLSGLEASNEEVRCPECGRHTAASLLR